MKTKKPMTRIASTTRLVGDVNFCSGCAIRVKRDQEGRLLSMENSKEFKSISRGNERNIELHVYAVDGFLE